jgi:hypothetical protein
MTEFVVDEKSPIHLLTTDHDKRFAVRRIAPVA